MMLLRCCVKKAAYLMPLLTPLTTHNFKIETTTFRFTMMLAKTKMGGNTEQRQYKKC